MSVHTIEEISPTRRKFKITVPADDVQKSWDKVVKEVQASAEVRGFRKGKAPVTLIKTVYAQDIAKKVINSLVSDNYTQVAKESNLQILNQPTVEPESQLNENVDFSFSATVDIYAPVEIKDYKGFDITLPVKLSPTAEQEEIEKVLKVEAEHRAKPCEHDHEHGHVHDHSPLTEELTQKIKEEIKAYFDHMRSRSAYDSVVEQLLAKNSFEIADSLLESMLDQMIYNNEVVKPHKDPKQVNIRDKTLRDQYHEQAARQVKAVVALTHVAQQEKIVVPFAEVTKSVAHFLEANHWNFQQIRENQNALIQEHKNELTLMKAINFIVENANITWVDADTDAETKDDIFTT